MVLLDFDYTIKNNDIIKKFHMKLGYNYAKFQSSTDCSLEINKEVLQSVVGWFIVSGQSLVDDRTLEIWCWVGENNNNNNNNLYSQTKS